MTTLPAALCPVCADLLAAPVRTCERCQTPHHPECWDYLPGCAVFACEEQAKALPVASWPVAYRLLLLRAQAATGAYWSLLGSVGVLSFAAMLDIPPSVLPPGVATWLIGGSLALFVLGFSLTLAWGGLAIATRLLGGRELRERLQGDGDRKLQAALEKRVQAPSHRTSDRAVFWLAMGVAVSQFLKGILSTGSGATLGPFGLAIVLLILSAAYWMFLIIPVRVGLMLVGRERILANRVRVALPKKP